MTPDPAEAARQRALRRRRLQLRQTFVFGILLTGVLVVLLLALAFWSNVIPTPFARPFSSPAPTAPARPSVPCPPLNATAQPLTDISANVLNSTNESGLAARTGSELGQIGVAVAQQGNHAGPITTSAAIVAGPRGLAAAYTLTLLVPDAVVSLDDRSDETIDLILGQGFAGVLDPADIGLDPDEPLPAPAGCQPVEIPDNGTEEDAPEGESPDDEDEGGGDDVSAG